MNENNPIDRFIRAYPRQSLQLVLMGGFLVFQTLSALIGLVLYLSFLKKDKRYLPPILIASVIIFLVALVMESWPSFNVARFILSGIKQNASFFKLLLDNHPVSALQFLFQSNFNYLVSSPLLLATLLAFCDFIKENPHKKTMQNLQAGILNDEQPELSDKEIEAALKKIDETKHNGTVLGVSKYTGEVAVIPDKHVNQVVLVLGTTGSGKTVTLRRFYHRAITKGYPLIIVDGKPDDTNIDCLMQLCRQYNRKFIGFNCGNYLPYDPLSHGGYTELKDKIISLKDEWSSDYYRSIAEDYLQTTLEVLIKAKEPFDLKRVSDCLSYGNLTSLVREIQDQTLVKRVMSLDQYDSKDITGLQAHLNILIHSELGQFFEKNESTFNLHDSIQQDGVIYFALPALRFPSFSKVLGKLVINDIKAVIDRNTAQKKIFTIFDEFSVFAGEQVLNLVNMGRGKGVHAVFGTQGLADLDRIDTHFKNQILNCANTLICHRLNDKESAETISHWAGTKAAFNLTAQLANEKDINNGSIRINNEFIIHPDMIKKFLNLGECYYIGKYNKLTHEKLKIKFF